MVCNSNSMPEKDLIEKKIIHLSDKTTGPRATWLARSYSIDEMEIILQVRRRQSVSDWAKGNGVRKWKEGITFRLLVDDVHQVLAADGKEVEQLKEMAQIKYTA